MVSGYGVDLRVWLVGSFPRALVRRHETLLIRSAVRGRIHLVAAKEENLSGVGGFARRPVARGDCQLRLGKPVSDAVRRVPPVASVADVVDPCRLARLARAALKERALRRRERFERTKIGFAAEDRGNRHVDAGARELVRVVPTDHPRSLGFGHDFSSSSVWLTLGVTAAGDSLPVHDIPSLSSEGSAETFHDIGSFIHPRGSRNVWRSPMIASVPGERDIGRAREIIAKYLS